MTRKGGLKKPNATHKRSKPQRKRKKDSDDPEPSTVEDQHDDRVWWDPQHQVWFSEITIVTKGTSGKKVFSFKRQTPDYPDDMDVPPDNSDEGQPDQDSSIFSNEGLDDGEPNGFFSGEGESSYHSDQSFPVKGYALGSQLIPGAKEAIYGWRSDCYMIKTPGGKPVTPVFKGALVSGAQLNAATGSADFIPGALYSIDSVRYEHWESRYGGLRTDDPEFTNVHDFRNRNKEQGGPAEWTPGTVALTLETSVISSQKQSKFFEDNFLPSEAQYALTQAGYDPKEWALISSKDLLDEINEYNNARIQAMMKVPKALQYVGAFSWNNSMQTRLDWLTAIMKSY